MPNTIDPKPPTNPGLDYATLLAHGTRLIQQMAGDRWTDFNEHDPGVTLLEQLCYALTELSYRAAVPIEDLLAASDGAVDADAQALFTPRTILPCNPVTLNDLRRLLLDRIPQLGNLWVTPDAGAPVQGLYRIELYLPPAPAQTDSAAIRRTLHRVYARHRNLCEDLASIQILTPLAIQVGAHVTLTKQANPEEVLAALHHRAAQFFAPEPRRRSLHDLMDDRQTPAGIFTGPLLRNGFIDDAELQPRAQRFPLADLIRALAQTKGVYTLEHVTLQAGSLTLTRVTDLFEPGPSEIPVLNGPGLQPDHDFHFYQSGRPVSVDRVRAEALFAHLQQRQRTRYPLDPAYDQLLPNPCGHPTGKAVYDSIQNNLPAIYAVGPAGVPTSAGPRRSAQARQLKAYLLVFEQLMANFLADLSSLPTLYSTARTPPAPIQSVAGLVPGVGPLLRQDDAAHNYEHGIKRLSSGSADRRRRAKILDLLLALQGQEPPTAHPFALNLRRRILQSLPRATRRRGTAFNYLELPSALNIAEAEQRCGQQIGVRRNPLGSHRGHIDRTFEPVPGDSGPDTGPDTAHRDRFRIGKLPGEAQIALVCWVPTHRRWALLGRHPDRDLAIAAAARHLPRAVRPGPRLHFVEHTLLRFGAPGAGPFSAAECSLQLTAVLTASRTRRQNPAYLNRVVESLQRNLPAHLAFHLCVLSPRHYRHFLAHRRLWMRALRHRRPDAIEQACANLRTFLECHLTTKPEAPRT